MKNKKANTAIFMLVATIINIILMIAFILIGFVLLAKFGSTTDARANSIWTMVIFILSIALSWLIYSALVKAYTKRINVEGTFSPLFGRKKNKE